MSEGEDKYNNLNLAQIPPLNGRIGLKFFCTGKNMRILILFFVPQNYTAPVSYRHRVIQYSMLNYLSTPLGINNMPLSLFGGVENLLTKLQNHLSTGRGSVTAEP